MWRESDVFHGSEHVLIRAIIAYTENKSGALRSSDSFLRMRSTAAPFEAPCRATRAVKQYTAVTTFIAAFTHSFIAAFTSVTAAFDD